MHIERQCKTFAAAQCAGPDQGVETLARRGSPESEEPERVARFGRSRSARRELRHVDPVPDPDDLGQVEGEGPPIDAERDVGERGGNAERAVNSPVRVPEDRRPASQLRERRRDR